MPESSAADLRIRFEQEARGGLGHGVGGVLQIVAGAVEPAEIDGEAHQAEHHGNQQHDHLEGRRSALAARAPFPGGNVTWVPGVHAVQ